MTSVACIIIAGEGNRTNLIDEYAIPNALAAGFDEVLVVGTHHAFSGGRYLHVPALTHSTTDALVKRDVGTLASTSDWLFYLSDDHAVHRKGPLPDHWLDIGVPSRFCMVEGNQVLLNMGLDPSDPSYPYCGGHGGLFSRKLISLFPWSTQPHDRLWDLLSSRSLVAFGARLGNQLGWKIIDLTPETRPWL